MNKLVVPSINPDYCRDNDNHGQNLGRDWIKWFALGFVVALLTSCGGTPRQVIDTRVDTQIEVAEQVRQLLDRAANSQSPDRDQLYLRAAELLATTDEQDWARNLLGSIDPDLLFTEDFVRYTLVYSQVAINTDSYFLAQRILTNPRVEQQWQNFATDDAKLLRARRAELFALLGEANKSVYERVRLSDLPLEPDAIVANQDEIWESLMAMSTQELNSLSQTEPNTTLRGWYSLAALSKNNSLDLDRQQASIERWINEWPNHPASLFLPSDLQLLQQLAAQQPRSVALLLPLTHELYGVPARRLRDGFMAAYFQAMQNGSRVPQIRIFDTSYQNILTVYDTAVADGAEFIVGPLLKENVSDLSLHPDITVPTLALNNFDSPYGFPNNFYQFSLNPEGEAAQVAQRAWLEGHRRAMVLAPKDGPNDLGSRSSLAFTNAFEELGGQVVQRIYYGEAINYSRDIEAGLLIPESEQRRAHIRRLIGPNVGVEYEPRRRQDIDFVFLLANKGQAQQIKPTLRLHDAEEIPVFATSRVYSGGRGTNDRDLDGIKFNTLPWLFDNSDIKKDIAASSRNQNDEFYAVGIDSFRLYPRLPQLQNRLGSKYYGQTGALFLNEERKIQREQKWAQVVAGEARELPAVVLEAENIGGNINWQ